MVLIAALIVGVWLVVAQPWADAATKLTATPSPSASAETPTPEVTNTETPSSSPEPSTTETAAVIPCRAVDVLVEAVTDADTYPAGSLPQLSIALTNTGSADCTIDVGSATQVFTVSSGDDVWWRSTDCQQDPSSMVVTLAAGQTVSSAAPVVWDRTRSDVNTCADENRPRAAGGGASYHVAVAIGGFEARATQQILLE
ncbi:hypothetical protein DC31_07765 [Microbacterium sp. CH12i]|nr:hypothetical protein DC31_07765 [Microbacterium sp. CH12i]